LKANQIIQIEAKKDQVDPKQALSYVDNLLNDKANTMVQKNDSLMLLSVISPNVVEVNFMTADKPMILSKSLMQFWDEIQNHEDIQTVYVKTDDSQIPKLMKLVGWPIEDSDNPKYEWMVKK
jgi:hypothetical protein